MNTFTIDRTEAELYIIHTERLRQERLKVEGRFRYTLSDEGASDLLRLSSVVEEIGEVSKNLLAREGLVTDGEPTLKAIHKELSHVAALSVAWMEYLTQLMEKGIV
jgi:hypothetical protein